MARPLAEIEGKYEIVAKLREGGMGAIYRVRHRLLDEVRVVKVLRPQHEGDDELRRRFAHEARAAIRLRHPNVVQIFDFSIDETGAGLIVMENIDGIDLERLIRAGRRGRRAPPSVPLVLEVARQSLRALGYLHGQGFVHRDVSPDNLMLCVDVEGRPQVKLIDLGIAKRVDAESQLTVSGSFLGKFRYASPEHFGARGEGGIDRRSDLYSFGLVIYELLTGVYPLAADSTSQLIGAHLFHAPRPFDETDPSARLPPPVRSMVLRALEKDADARFADAAEWIAELESLQERWPADEEVSGEATRLAATPAEPDVGDAGEPPAPPGSSPPLLGETQLRFDRQFGLERTPAPGSARDSGGRPTSTQGGPVDEEALSALVDGARALHALGKVEQARRQLDTVLALDPDHRGARALVAELGAGPAAAGEEPEGAEDAAPPPPPPLPAAAESTGAAEEAGGSEIRRLLERAEEHIQSGEYEDGLELLHRARAAAPAEGSVVEELARAVSRIDAGLQARERRRAIEQIERHVLASIRRGRLATARRDVARARRAYGRDEVLATLDRILDGVIGDRVGELRRRAAASRDEERWDEARQALDAALDLLAEEEGWESDAAPGELRRAVEEDLEALRDERMRFESSQVLATSGLLAAVAEIERLRIEEGKEAARRALELAAGRFGESSVLDEVRRSLAEEPRRDGSAGLIR